MSQSFISNLDVKIRGNYTYIRGKVLSFTPSHVDAFHEFLSADSFRVNEIPKSKKRGKKWELEIGVTGHVCQRFSLTRLAPGFTRTKRNVRWHWSANGGPRINPERRARRARKISCKFPVICLANFGQLLNCKLLVKTTRESEVGQRETGKLHRPMCFPPASKFRGNGISVTRRAR